MRFFQVLKHRLILFTLFIGIVPTLFVGLLLYTNAKNEITLKTHEIIAAHSLTVGMRLEDYFETRERQAHIIANTPVIISSIREFVNNQWEYDHPRWQENMANIDQFASIVISQYVLNGFFITNNDGILIYDLSTASPVPLGLNLPERSVYFNDALQIVKGGEKAWLEQNYSPVSQSINLILNVPLFASGYSSEVIGSLNMGMGHTDVDRLVHRGVGDIGLTANAYLIDEKGLLRSTPFLDSSSSMVPLQTQIDSEAVNMLNSLFGSSARQAYDTSEYIDYRGEEVLGNVTITKLGSTPVGLVVEMQDEEVYAGLFQLRDYLILILLIFFFLVLTTSFLMSNSIAGPIRKIQGWAQELASGYYKSEPVSSRLSTLKLWIKPFQFYPCCVSCKLPVYCF